MKITYKSKKLENICSDFSIAKKVHGNQIAQMLFDRIEKLKSAETLKDLSTIRSLKFHSLKGSRKDEFAVSLTKNVRLIFTSNDGRVELTQIKSIRVENIEDYH